jgi:hypothetical protein
MESGFLSWVIKTGEKLYVARTLPCVVKNCHAKDAYKFDTALQAVGFAEERFKEFTLEEVE